jgi:Na+:H+ antiporter, NhaA family
MKRDQPRLPKESADLFTQPIAQFLKIEAASGLLLLLATVTALGLANSTWSAGFLEFWETPIGLHFGATEFSRSLRHWINDGLMTLFFFVVALELKRELVLGELRELRGAALPFAGALGGMIVPASLYLAIMNGQPGAQGWGTVMATDTAFVVGCLGLFGSRIPSSLRLFLLSLAIFDDVGAILVVAVAYSGEALNWGALLLAMIGLALIAGSARLGIRSIAFYLLMGGAIWLCVDQSGIHPTVTGVVLGLMTPTRVWISDTRLRGILERVLSYPKGEHWSKDTTERRDLRRAGVAITESLSPLERLEMMFHPWASFAIMPIFALANAGVAISLGDIGQPISVAIFSGLVIGKPIGVLAFSWFAVQFGFATRPAELGWKLLAGGALLTGIGFSMSLFIAGLAFPPAMLNSAKIAILTGSLFSASLGLSLLAWLTLRKRGSLHTRQYC